MLPNFLIIGTQRAATTWLLNCLKEHPEVFMPDVKEPHFFDVHYERGISYYASFFQGADGFKAIGEKSPDYLPCKACPERMAKNLPHAKMIAILRDPIDRALSAYRKFVFPKKRWSFEEAIKKKPSLVEYGLYYEQLQRYLSYFQREHFLILFYEDIVQNNRHALKKVFQFVEVDPAYQPSWIGKTNNASLSPLFNKVAAGLKVAGIFELVLRSKMGKKLREFHQKKKLNSQPSSAEMNNSTRRNLLAYYEEPNKKLEKLLQRDLSFWPYFN